MTAVPMKVTLIDRMGDDRSVVNAARVSFSKEVAEMRPSDEKLIGYLARCGHWTPFAHAIASFRIKAPIFVARQLAKHQIGLSWNESSRRYVDDTPEYWLPDAVRSRPDGSIKQGSGAAHPDSEFWLSVMEPATEEAINVYRDLIAGNVAPEQARMVLPLNVMTEWIWTGSLAAWARMCKLRLDAHAQKETREIALFVAQDMVQAFPVSWAAMMGVKDSE